jgi:hypothetical protein
MASAADGLSFLPAETGDSLDLKFYSGAKDDLSNVVSIFNT